VPSAPEASGGQATRRAVERTSAEDARGSDPSDPSDDHTPLGFLHTKKYGKPMVSLQK